MDNEIRYECGCGIGIGDMLESGHGIKDMQELIEHCAYDHIGREKIYKKVTVVTVHIDTREIDRAGGIWS